MSMIYKYFTYESQALNKDVCFLCVCPEYADKVVFFLHGSGGMAVDLDRGLGLEKWADKLRAMIIAPDMPSNFYISRQGYNVNELFAEELPKYIEENIEKEYGIAHISQFVIGGVSMGGFGAALVALSQPQRFKQVFSISGAFIQRDIINEEDSVKCYRHAFEPIERMEYDLTKNPDALIERFSPTQVRPNFLLTCGQEDDFGFYPKNQRMVRNLTRNGFECEFIAYPGKHDFETFRESLTHVKDWLEA